MLFSALVAIVSFFSRPY